jgi:hypothetical protein
MTRVLDEKVVIRLMRESWKERRENVLREVTALRDDKPILSPGLKIVDEEGNLFTVISVGTSGAMLEDASDATSIVPWDRLEKEFKLQ